MINWSRTKWRVALILQGAGLACYFTVGADLRALCDRLFDDGDLITVLWTMDCIGYNATHGIGLADLPMFFPNKGVLFFSGHLLLPSLFYYFFKLLVSSPVFAFNLTLLAFLVLNFLAMVVFCRNFAGRGPAVLGGILFAFASYRLSQIGHPQIMAQFFLPLVGHYLFQFERSRKNSDWMKALLCLAGQFYLGIYQGLIACLTLLPYLLLRTVFQTKRFQWAIRLFLSSVLWGVLLLPLAVPYSKVMNSRHVERPLSEAHIYGAHLTHFFAAPESGLWHSVTEPLLRARHHMVGKRLFVGVAAFIFAFLAFRWIATFGREKRFLFWLCGSSLVFLIWMSHGPQALLYNLFHEYIPGFKALRAPSRIGFGYLFVMAALVAMGAESLRRRHTAGAAILGLLLGSLLIVENKIQLDKKVPPTEYAAIVGTLASGDGPFAHLPLVRPMYPRFFASLRHHRPMFNGESAFLPEPQRSAYEQEAQMGPTPELLDTIRAHGIGEFVVESGHAWETVLKAHCHAVIAQGPHGLYRCGRSPVLGRVSAPEALTKN
ncbi:MAG: hypothetical protein KDD51_04895 [Bdellovibrionales bacterium]|nr:hypothetical protein [Bdellovibrionales bacterium]